MSDSRAFKEYGFTNDLAHLERIKAYRDAAVADGWTIEPTYGDHESVERASKLRKDGFTMSVLTRDKRNDDARTRGKWNVEAHVSLWGPDGMSIKVPEAYDWQAIQDAVHVCENCGQHVEVTHRFSFAGRCCSDCLPEMRKKHEYPGWTN